MTTNAADDLVSMSDINNIARCYGVRWTIGTEGETVSATALPLGRAADLADALTAAGHEASTARDHEQESLWWVYVTAAEVAS